MRLLRLEVENFRGVRSAKLDFGPGVNVLHGPNELGKSTLAEAVRAALLTKPSSTQADTYLRWDDAVPTRVTLTFEVGGEVWRVTKRFSSPSSALLERQVGAQAGKWHTIAEAGNVEGKLRELLSWGMAPPGGRGALSRKDSYLVVALLGRQGEVQQIFKSSLEDDPDDTGKVSITKALGALGSDPRVTGIIERLVERTDEVFTPTGRVKQTADSPLFKLQQKVQAAVAELRVLEEKAAESRKIAALVVAAHDEWLRLSCRAPGRRGGVEGGPTSPRARQGAESVAGRSRRVPGHARPGGATARSPRRPANRARCGGRGRAGGASDAWRLRLRPLMV